MGSSSVGEDSCSGSRAVQLDDQTRDICSSEITLNILDQTPMTFGTVKEAILDILDVRLSTFHAEIVALIRMWSPTFKEFQTCGAPDYHGATDAIASSRWLAGVADAFRTSCCPDGGQGHTSFLSHEGNGS